MGEDPARPDGRSAEERHGRRIGHRHNDVLDCDRAGERVGNGEHDVGDLELLVRFFDGVHATRPGDGHIEAEADAHRVRTGVGHRDGPGLSHGPDQA